ncbi:MAG: hypothetical protein ACOZQL_03340 [Myxococcota bacterium]
MASKKEERAFLRGEVGVDGQAVEEEKDAAQVEAAKAQEALLRGRTWLGRECLTWLLWKSESTEPVVNVEGKPVTVVFNGKLGLRAGGGEVTEAQVKGVTSPYSQLVKHALGRGLLVHTAKLQATWNELVFDFSLDAEFFDIRSAKLPTLLQEEEGERLTERLELATRASILSDALVAAFIKERTSKAWGQKIVPELKKWMAA